MDKELYKDEEWLRKQLVDKERTAGEVAEGFDITRATINRWKRKFDITLPTDWTEDEVGFLKEHAHEMSATDIAEELGRTRASVNHYAHRHDISMEKPHSVYADKMSKGSRKYDFDEDFFARDTPEANYWAGALVADGCVHERDANSHTISLKISKKDITWLKKFKSSINATHPLNKSGEFIELKIHSNKMFRDLNRFGVVPRKTYKCAKPQVSDDMINHFIRGLFDGDGSICKVSGGGYKYPKATLVNNQAVAEWSLNVIKDKLSVGNKLYQKNNSEEAYYWEITNGEDVSKFGKWMYNNTNIFMDRKYKRFLNYNLLDNCNFSHSEVMP